MSSKRTERREDLFGYELHRTVASLLPERGEEIRRVGLRNLAEIVEGEAPAIQIRGQSGRCAVVCELPATTQEDTWIYVSSVPKTLWKLAGLTCCPPATRNGIWAP